MHIHLIKAIWSLKQRCAIIPQVTIVELSDNCSKSCMFPVGAAFFALLKCIWQLQTSESASFCCTICTKNTLGKLQLLIVVLIRIQINLSYWTWTHNMILENIQLDNMTDFWRTEKFNKRKRNQSNLIFHKIIPQTNVFFKIKQYTNLSYLCSHSPFLLFSLSFMFMYLVIGSDNGF